MATSPNQQVFRDFQKELNSYKKLYRRDKLLWSYDEFASLLLDEKEFFLEQIFGNDVLWDFKMEKAISLALQKFVSVVEPPEQTIIESDTRDAPDIFFAGLELLSRNFSGTTGIRYRARLFTDIESILEYVSELPSSIIRGLEPVYSGNKIVGFRLWLYDES